MQIRQEHEILASCKADSARCPAAADDGYHRCSQCFLTCEDSRERDCHRYARSVHRRLPVRGYGGEAAWLGGTNHMSRIQLAFGALVVAQAAHSVEEYVGRLWESFPPAQFLTGLISRDLEQGFVIINVSLVAFGFWCFLWPVRREWPAADGLAWLWVAIELINGIGHPLWSLSQFGYTPGLATAPVLLVLALYLAIQLMAPKQTTA